jgi:large subunit ribosomal protein L10
MLKVEKEKTVSELKEKLSAASSLFLTDFRGLNVDEMTRLRRTLKEKGAEYRVTKNTLIRRAAQESELEGILDFLAGPTGLVFSYEDPLAPARALHEVYRKIKKPKIKVIWMEGRFFGESHLKTLAALPGREMLLAQIASGLNFPVANFVGTLEGMLRSLVGVIEAIRKEKSEAGKKTAG